MRFCFALVAAALLTGSPYSSAETPSLPEDASTNPHLKAAQQLVDSNPSGAADEYEAAVAADPKLAIAHYELGLLYAEKLSQPINSIYHLQRFLKLAPTNEHAANARQLVSQESDAFAASLPNASPTVAQVSKLQRENAAYKKQVDDAAQTISKLQAQLAQAGVPRPAQADATGAAPVGVTPAAGILSPTPPAPVAGTTTPAAADASGGRTYTVVKGDSLWKIAHKMYPHDTQNGVVKIQDANKDAIGGKPLKIGQVLIIP